MRHTAVLIAASALTLTLAACGKPADEAPGGMDAPPPADAPAAPTAPAAPPAPEPVGDYGARGTEPFWAVDVTGASLKLTRPDHPDLSATVATTDVDGNIILWKAQGAGGPVTLEIRQVECSDGMSDLKYAYSARVTLGDEILDGCGFKAGEQPREGQ